MDKHLLKSHGLPLDPQREAHFAGSREVLHLLHGVLHWLLIPIAAGVVIWFGLLVLSLLGWGVWGLAWTLRRASSALPLPDHSPPAAVKREIPS